MIQLHYRGRRVSSKDTIIHLYDRVGVPEDEAGIYFKKKLAGYHRIGDVLEAEEPKPGTFRTEGKVIEHRDGAEDELADRAAYAVVTERQQAKKRSKRSDLDGPLELLRNAMRRERSPIARAALLVWIVREVQR